MNVLKPHLRTTIETLLGRGVSQREIERRTGVDRKTIRRYAASANSSTPATGSESVASQTPPPWPPGWEGPDLPETTPTEALTASQPAAGGQTGAVSACEAHREWIESQVRLDPALDVDREVDLRLRFGSAEHGLPPHSRRIARTRSSKLSIRGRLDYPLFQRTANLRMSSYATRGTTVRGPPRTFMIYWSRVVCESGSARRTLA